MKHLWTFVYLSIGTISYSQSVGIGTTNPESSAILDVSSTTKGLLLPRMTTAQRDAIVAPVQGLSIFNTDDRCTDTYSGQSWSKNCTMKDNGAFTLPANSWRPRADFGGIARREAVGFSIGTKGYIGTGSTANSSGSFKKDFWEYDPATNIWAQKADFGGSERFRAVGFSIGTKGYIGTGYDVSFRKDFWEYDSNTNIWTQKADFGGFAIEDAVGFSIGTKGYIGTGYDVNYRKDFWEYDPSINVWNQKAAFGGTARDGAVGFSIGTKGYIGTGYNVNYKKDFWEYDPSTNVWNQKADFGGTSRSVAVGFSINGKGYIGTGFDGVKTKDFWEFDPTTNLWVIKPDFAGIERNNAVGFSIGTKGYIGTGFGEDNLNDFWEYNTLPNLGKEYTETIPVDATKYKGHDWTSEANKLYTTLEDVDLAIRGNATFNGSTSLSYNNILEFGKGLSKETYAGKIGYQTFTDGLDIIGAGTSYPNRKIKIFDRLYFDNISENRKLVLYETANNAHQFYGIGIESGTLRFQVAGAGNVHRFYAGTSASTSKLLYTIYDSGDVVAERDAYAVVNMFAQGFYPTSDKKLKKNLVRTTNSLANIIKLNGYNYNWVDNNYPTLQTGLIAQEVQEIYPHLVIKNKDGNLGVNYNALVPELIEAIKALTLRLSSLQEENDAMKKEIKSIYDLLAKK